MIKKTGFITRVVCTPDGLVREPGMTITDPGTYDTVVCTPGMEKEAVIFENHKTQFLVQTEYEFTPREICRFMIEGGKARIVTKKTIDGERSFVENAATVKTGDSYSCTLRFRISGEEAIYGLGQHERGTYNYRNTKEYLYQNNMQIPMPVFLSSAGYAVVFDADCLMTYEEAQNEIRLDLDAADQINYYVITGEGFDRLVEGIRCLTGQAVMLPRWAFGYIQSKERYVSQEDILDTRKEFKDRQIPLSCLVLDWKSWEEGKWGNKIMDKNRFPDLSSMTEQLHEDDTAFMVSIWPNMNRGCENNREMLEAGKLLANLSTYDAFDPEARDLYWRQCEQELFLGGTDAWWCDSTEPFTPDWNGLEKREDGQRYELAKSELTKYFDARIANNFALAHAKGIYEHQTAACREKRVVNLTRSGSLSIQKYGTVLWSGDIMATWDVFRRQIAEGLSMCMSGIPYWTLDIGAFFAGSTQGFRRFSNVCEGEAPWFWQGLFEKGVQDLGYRELYTRWLQMGTFLPVMRSHGTDTPREPWNFGEPGEKYYDTIVSYIRFRYKMLPYSYSLAHMVEEDSYTMFRSLMFDFACDPQVKNMAGEFMYGPAYLVCPVTKAMEYGPENEKLKGPKSWEVYLPAGVQWYHQKTKEFYAGGRAYEVEAPVTWQPVFIRAGSIIPVDSKCGKKGIADTIEVYEGADGRFLYYMDNGMDYRYREGQYAAISMQYNDETKILYLDKVQGSYDYPRTFGICFYRKDGTLKKGRMDYCGKTASYMFG